MLSDHYGSPSRDIIVLGEQRSKKEGMNSSSCQFASCTSTLGKSLTRESWKKLIRPLITVSQGFVNTKIRRVAAYYSHPPSIGQRNREAVSFSLWAFIALLSGGCKHSRGTDLPHPHPTLSLFQNTSFGWNISTRDVFFRSGFIFKVVAKVRG